MVLPNMRAQRFVNGINDHSIPTDGAFGDRLNARNFQPINNPTARALLPTWKDRLGFRRQVVVTGDLESSGIPIGQLNETAEITVGLWGVTINRVAVGSNPTYRVRDGAE